MTTTETKSKPKTWLFIISLILVVLVGLFFLKIRSIEKQKKYSGANWHVGLEEELVHAFAYQQNDRKEYEAEHKRYTFESLGLSVNIIDFDWGTYKLHGQKFTKEGDAEPEKDVRFTFAPSLPDRPAYVIDGNGDVWAFDRAGDIPVLPQPELSPMIKEMMPDMPFNMEPASYVKHFGEKKSQWRLYGQIKKVGDKYYFNGPPAGFDLPQDGADLRF